MVAEGRYFIIVNTELVRHVYTETLRPDLDIKMKSITLTAHLPGFIVLGYTLFYVSVYITVDEISVDTNLFWSVILLL